MKVDHANMPGMDHAAMKPAKGKPAAASRKAVPAKSADAPVASDKAKSQRKSGKA